MRGFQAELPASHSPLKLASHVLDELKTAFTVPGTGAALEWLSSTFSAMYLHGAEEALKEEESLTLPGATLSDEHAEYVGLLAGRGARAVAPHLNKLDLRGSHLTGSGLKRLAAALACDGPGMRPQLRTIDLWGVLQRTLESGALLDRSAGGEALGMIVRRTPTLTSLVAGGHPLKAAGVKPLAQAIASHSALTSLDLQQVTTTPIPSAPHASYRLAQHLVTRRSEPAPIVISIAPARARALQADLDKGAVDELVDAISKSPHLRYLDSRHNALPKDLKEKLSAAASKKLAMRKVEAKGKGETAEPLSLDVEPQTPRVNRKGSTATGKGDKKGNVANAKKGKPAWQAKNPRMR